MTISAVIFDVDGTLVDYERARRSGFLSFLQEVPQYRDATAWPRWCAAEETHFGRYRTGELSFDEQRRERVREFTGVRLDDEGADAWFARYLVHYESAWRLFDDVVLTLDELEHLRLFAFSNVTGAYTRRKLAHLALLDRFEAVHGADEVGGAKPERRTFGALCRLLDVEGNETLHVGDRYDMDAVGACNAGLRGVWLGRPGAVGDDRARSPFEDRRVAVVTTLRQLLSLTAG